MSYRSLLAFIVLSILIFSINSCSKKEENKTITFWHFWSEPYQKKALQVVIDDFEKETGLKVKSTELSWNDGKTKLMAAFNSGTSPDVLELGSDWVAQFSSSGVLQEINKDSSEIDKFIPFSTEPCFWDNKIYALPWFVDTRTFFVNNSILNENDQSIPKSWEEVLEISKVINGKNGKYAFGSNGPDKNRLYKKAITFLWSSGGDLINNNQVKFNTPENAYAMKMYADLSEYGIIEKQRNLDEFFVKGDLAFNISGGWLLEKIKNENPELDFSVIPIPGMNGREGVSFAGGEYLSISSSSDNQNNALKFIKYLTSGENTIKFCKQVIEAGFPADKNYYNDEYYKSKQNRMVFSKQLENAKMTPVSPNWFEIQDLLERAFEEVIYKEDEISNVLEKTQKSLEDVLSD